MSASPCRSSAAASPAPAGSIPKTTTSPCASSAMSTTTTADEVADEPRPAQPIPMRFAVRLDASGRFRRRQAAGALCRGREQRGAAAAAGGAGAGAAARRPEPEGRKFVPHVTLARLRGATADRGGAVHRRCRALRAAEFPVGRFVLFSSRRTRWAAAPIWSSRAYPLAA